MSQDASWEVKSCCCQGAVVRCPAFHGDSVAGRPLQRYRQGGGPIHGSLSAGRRISLSILLALAFLLTLSTPARGENLPPLRIPDAAVGSRCFGLLPCTQIDPFGIRLRIGAIAYFRPERQHDRDFYAARLTLTPSVTLFQWAEIGIAIPITLYKKEIGVFPAYEPLQPFGRVRIPVEKILGGIDLAGYVRIHLARSPFVSGLPPIATQEGPPLSLMAEAVAAYQKQSAFEAGLVAQKRVGPVTFSAAISVSVGPDRAEVSGGGELTYHWKPLHAFMQGRGLGVPQCPPNEAALGFCSRGFQFLTGVRLDLDLGPGALAIGTGSGVVEPGWVVGAQVGLDYDEKVRRMHGDGIEAAHKWWERRFEAMARGWAAWKNAAVFHDEAGASKRSLPARRGHFSDRLGVAMPPPSSPWLDSLLDDDTLSESWLIPDAQSGAQPSGPGSKPWNAQTAKAKAALGRKPRSRSLYVQTNAHAALHRRIAAEPQFALPGSLDLMTDEELTQKQWQVMQEDLRRAEQQRWREASQLPPMEKAVLNFLATFPYEASLFLLEMSGPEAAAEIEEVRQRLRPLKYTPAEREAGAAMEGAYRSMLLALGPVAAEQAMARQAMLAAARANAHAAGHAAEFAAAQEVALSSAAEQGAISAEQSGPRFAGILDRLPPRLNPLNYECCGLGSNFGNLRFKPPPAAGPSTGTAAMDTIAEHEVPAVAPRRNLTSGETPAAARGRQAHKEWDPGPGYRKEERLLSGRRPDAINYDTREVVELKPDNPRAIRRGQKQVEEYRQELEQTDKRGLKWTGRVEIYKP